MKSSLSNLVYRPDIDGLRAIAVLLVLAYHLPARFVDGGFIGVDIFLVISGFLITSILLRELQSSQFTITGFYVRRIRRIAPALLTVLCATTVVAYFFLLPVELLDYARSLIACIFSSSNFYFWQHADYFNSATLTKPLLHTWSLAVEEQFYIFFPLLLAFLYQRHPRRLLQVLAVIAGCSFLISARTAFTHPNFAFYWPVSRTWELLCGSILVLVELPGMKDRWVRNAASALGLGLIGFAAFAYSKYSPAFPGIAALAPCLGAVLIIGAGSHGSTLVGRFLSWRPVVFVGLISYSLYLWHWPVICFQSLGLTANGLSTPQQKLLVVAISTVLAILSWRFVEQPFRRSGRLVIPAKVFRFAAVFASVPAAVACVFLFTKGMPSRFPLRAVRVASTIDYTDTGDEWHYRTGSCFIIAPSGFRDFDKTRCLKQSSTLSNYLLLGDSHAAHLFYGLAIAYPEVNFLQATASGCKPTLAQGVDRQAQCTKIMDFALRDFLPKSQVKVVLLGAHWREADLDHLGTTISYLKQMGIAPVIIGPIVQYDSSLPRLLAFSIKNADPLFAERHRVAAAGDLDAQMQRLARDVWRVKYISYFDALCKGDKCQEYAAPDVPLQHDSAHLTSEGSLWVAKQFREKQILPVGSLDNRDSQALLSPDKNSVNRYLP